MSGTVVDAGRASAAPARSAEGAGLVPSKTSLKTVNFAPSAVAERRVKRLKKSVWASGHLHGIADKGHRAPKVWFITLTYALADRWSAKHISEAIQGFRNWCKARALPCRYTWVAEIQPKRLERTGENVVHYHLLAWLPQHVTMPFWDKPTKTPSGRYSATWWPYGMTNTDVAKAGVGYLMKYLSKLGELTRFPKGLRLYGIGGLPTEGRAVRSWYNLPEWVKLTHGVGEVCRASVGYVVRLTGEILEPAYKVIRIPDGMQLMPLRELPERFHSGAYSTFPRVSHA